MFSALSVYSAFSEIHYPNINMCLYCSSFLPIEVVEAEQEVVIEPGTSLNIFTSLNCLVTPENLTIAIRWILPGGDIVTEDTTGRFFVSQGPGGNTGGRNVLLLIDQLSYQDDGVYTCEVMDLDPTIPDAPWIPATVQLQLNGKSISSTNLTGRECKLLPNEVHIVFSFIQ